MSVSDDQVIEREEYQKVLLEHSLIFLRLPFNGIAEFEIGVT